jgi:hypothetical protein
VGNVWHNERIDLLAVEQVEDVTGIFTRAEIEIHLQN